MESGKTTIFRQLDHIYNDGHQALSIGDAGICAHFIHVVAENIINAMKTLITDVVRIHGEDVFTESARSAFSHLHPLLSPLDCAPTDFVKEYKDDFKALWADSAIKDAFSENKSVSISPTLKYYLDDLDRFMSDDYTLTMEDLIHFNKRTTQMNHIDVNLHENGAQVVVFDSTQRRERRKWHQLDNLHTVILPVALHHFDRNCYHDDSCNALRESHVLDCMDSICKWFKHCRFVLLFTFKDVFEHQIQIQGKSVSQCFEDYYYRNTDPNGIGHRRMVIVKLFLMEIADSNEYEVPDELILLCGLFWGDDREVQFAMNFIIEKFKEKIPSEKKEDFSIHSICALDTEEVKEVFDEIFSDISLEHDRAIKAAIRKGKENEVERMKSVGMKEMKIIFPVFIISMIVVSLILVFVPFKALCYLEVTVSAMAFIAAIVVLFCGRKRMELEWCIVVTIIGLMMIGEVVAVIMVDNHQSDVERIVYLGFPMGMMFMYFVCVSYTTFYWFWHQCWTLFWFGIMMIITGLIVDNNVKSVMWIIGICFAALSLFSPSAAFQHLKRKQQES